MEDATIRIYIEALPLTWCCPGSPYLIRTPRLRIRKRRIHLIRISTQGNETKSYRHASLVHHSRILSPVSDLIMMGIRAVGGSALRRVHNSWSCSTCQATHRTAEPESTNSSEELLQSLESLTFELFIQARYVEPGRMYSISYTARTHCPFSIVSSFRHDK